jgi:lipopolysaccharide export system permease protein
MPVSYNKLKIRLGVMRDSYISSIVEVRKFNQISKDTTLYIDGRDSDSNLYGVILFDNRKPETRSVIFARHGKFNLEDGEAYFQLQQGLRQAYDSNKHMTRLYFDDLTVTIEKEQLDVSNKKKNSLESFIGEMLYPDPNMHPDTQKRRIADGHLRIIWPFFNIVFTILGLSYFLKIRPSRNSQWSKIMHSFLPVLLAAIVHFTLQKFAYKNLDIIFLCYANVLLCIIIGFLQCRRAKM